MPDPFTIIGLTSNILSFGILAWQLYKKILEDCRYNPYEPTELMRIEEQRRLTADMHKLLVDINNRQIACHTPSGDSS